MRSSQRGYKKIELDSEKIGEGFRLYWPENTPHLVVYCLQDLDPATIRTSTLFIKQSLGLPQSVAVYHTSEAKKSSIKYFPASDSALLGNGLTGQEQILDVSTVDLYKALFPGVTDTANLELKLAGFSDIPRSFLRTTEQRSMLDVDLIDSDNNCLMSVIEALKSSDPDLQFIAIEAEASELDFDEQAKFTFKKEVSETTDVLNILKDEYWAPTNSIGRKFKQTSQNKQVSADTLYGHYLVVLDSSTGELSLSRNRKFAPDQKGEKGSHPVKDKDGRYTCQLHHGGNEVSSAVYGFAMGKPEDRVSPDIQRLQIALNQAT